MKKRKTRGEVTPLFAEVTAVMRDLATSANGVHPEIWARWPAIVGPQTYRRAFPKALKGKVLYVAVSNSSWLHELGYLRQDLIDRLAEEIGLGVVEEIRFVLDTAGRPAD